MSDSSLTDGQSSRPADAVTEPESTASVIAAMLANIAVGIVKFIAAGISGSSAMVSEGIHSIVDSGNGALVLFGIKRSQKKPDALHPFGYGMELYFWTMVVAVMIFALGGGLSIYQGAHSIAAGAGESGDPLVNYVVIGAGAIIEGISLRIALKQFNEARGNIPPFQFIRDAKDPSLFTVVLEDSAAELGLVFAFLGVFGSHALNMPVLDGVASVLIGMLLCVVACVLLRETKGLLIGEGLPVSALHEIERIVEDDARVVECGRILTMFMGPHDLLVAIDATFSADATRDDIVKSVDAIEGNIVAAFPECTRIFIESESLRFTRAQRVGDITSG